MTILDALFPAVPENTPNPNSKLLSSCLEIDKEKHIAIVGGGPAGVHMSACLAAKGYKVTLLESEQELGGKSLTIYDPLQPAVPQEMGTCYMHPGYTPIRKLLEEYDKDNLEINFANEKNGRMIFGLTLDDESKRKYTEGMEYFDWVFEQTEKRNGLELLAPIFIYSQQVQGYGILDKIPAFYLLWWIHPDVANGSIRSMLGSDELLVSMLKNGYQSLWKNMAKRHSDQVNYITGAQVTAIKRTPSVEIKYMLGGEEKVLEADMFVSAIDMYRFSHLITDLDPEEKEVFSKLTESTLATTLYKGKTVAHEHTVEFWFARQGVLTSDGVGQFHAQRNSRMATRPEIPAVDDTELRVAYQYSEKPPQSGDAAKLSQALMEGLKTFAGEPEVEIRLQKPWPYFPRFEAQDLVKGCPWKILEMQGKRNTVFIGSSVCFESVLDVVCYNQLLARKICG
ncbi:unnamed protein product [Effrenium voratum]|uniref:Amine oxidase domain-containing protein n=1 Tax=Effrenium voratum TaxID=2562239 RepID=A0AA36MXE3_9DINO|nr:unnamed protein product [Effrenium voratum]